MAFPPNPMVTTARTVVAPSWVLAGVSCPLSVLTSQKVTQEDITIMYRGMYTCRERIEGYATILKFLSR